MSASVGVSACVLVYIHVEGRDQLWESLFFETASGLTDLARLTRQ